MKKTIFGTLLLVVAANSQAVVYEKSGYVDSLSVLSSNLAYKDAVHIEGFTSAGSCQKNSDGLVTLRIRNDNRGDRQLSIILSARIAGKPLTVTVDDAVTDANRGCYIRSVKIKD